MKKQIKWLLASATAACAVLAANTKDARLRVAATIASVACSAPLLIAFGKKAINDVDKECDETEKLINELGLDVESMDSDLIDSEVDKAAKALDGLEEDINHGTPLYSLYLQARQVFDDEMLDYYPGESFKPGTVHVLQKNKTLVLGMQLPGNQRGQGPGDIDIYQYFKRGDFKEEVLDSLECAGIFVYRKGIVHYNEKPFEKFEFIEKEDGELISEYYLRISQLIESWNKFEGFRKEMKADYEKQGKELRGYYNFLFIEIPIKMSGSILPGITITKTLSLLRRLTEEGANVVSKYGTQEETFELNRILIHPGEDLGKVFTVAIQDDENDNEVRVIKTIDI